jgi:hypothetical protein
MFCPKNRRDDALRCSHTISSSGTLCKIYVYVVGFMILRSFNPPYPRAHGGHEHNGADWPERLIAHGYANEYKPDRLIHPVYSLASTGLPAHDSCRACARSVLCCMVMHKYAAIARCLDAHRELYDAMTHEYPTLSAYAALPP